MLPGFRARTGISLSVKVIRYTLEAPENALQERLDETDLLSYDLHNAGVRLLHPEANTVNALPGNRDCFLFLQ